ncbi:HET-domain-containing protein [Cucurbitaria berberidis CBS 394.84]|uniref:HET-domain-containing protein n=1 Tax=Cucurbitaria berberidis CBS 394.84 TaxID=1168544 RepID=A0A9P4GQQ6_9PLEO|nr:HET-domain-containing protein [Cucurbitaria berberidis CBS 394.84]KAF1849597.1 HET-domain-containing protein [Cucurbitaria berberidis CBS 394.84]
MTDTQSWSRVLSRADQKRNVCAIDRNVPQSSVTYRYQPLETAESIRLLKIDGDPPFDVQYSIVHTTITTAPDYETLSYVWGTPNRTSTISLYDGSLLRVTKYLKSALPHISKHCLTRFIWIDQISINQDDLLEKNHQVPLMRSIYSGCYCVIVWLGRLSMLPIENTSLEDIFSCVNELEVRRRQASGPISQEPLDSRFKKIAQSEEASWDLAEDLRDIVTSPWSTRGWVFQEAVLPRDSKLILGEPLIYKKGGTVSLEGLNRTLTAYYDNMTATHLTADYSLRQNEFQSFLAILKGWSDHVYFFGPRPPFEHVLSLYSPRAKTTCALDQLYAFFGLNDNQFINLPISYETRMEDALVSTTQGIIRGTLRLDIFECIPRIGVISIDLPSWVPNFVQPRSTAPFTRPVTYGVWNTPQPLGNIWLGYCDARTLHAYGRRIDTIQADLLDGNGNGYPTSDKEYIRILSYACSLTPKDAGSPTMERLLRALVAGDHGIPLRGNEPLSWQKEDVDTVASFISARMSDSLLGNTSEHYRQIKKHLEDFMTCKKQTMFDRDLYLTRLGRFATGTRLRPGDVICILHGCTHPVALRARKASTFEVLGTCYLEGWMDAWNNGMVDWDVHDTEEFVLV